MKRQRDDKRHAAGLTAALGRRKRVASASRARALQLLETFDERFRHDRPGDYLEFVPSSKDPGVLADLSARINWYLSNRTVPIFMEGAAGVAVRPDDAPYMDPALVRDPGWANRRPQGRPELIIHDLRVRSFMRYTASRRRATITTPWFAWTAERNWFALHQRFSVSRTPEARTSAELLLDRARSAQSAFVLGTGPSASLVDPDRVDADVRIVCNSVVRNQDLLRKLAPDVIAFSDPVFHCGPSRYAAGFREDLRRALDETDAVLLTGDHWIGPVLVNCPDIADRIAVLRFSDNAPWRWPTADDFSVRTTSNVLTLLMLPAAFALADRIEIAGCDGRQPQERYFWKHNAGTQYSDELMQSVFAAHPAFFRDRDYEDYYEQHCVELEELIATGEASGKSVVSVTPSYIPALATRGEQTMTVSDRRNLEL
jgi:hypothetical protein